MRTVLAVLVATAAAGCAVTAPVSNYHSVREAIDAPKPGMVVEVPTGKEMVRHGNITAARGIRLVSSVRIGRYKLSPGFYPRMGEDASFTYHSYRAVRTADEDDGVIASVGSGSGRWATAPDAVRMTRDGSEICLIFSGEGRKSCRRSVPSRSIVRYRLGEHDLQQKLIFDGASNDTIRLTYREESGHYARPPMTKQVEFAGPLPRVIEYKGARIRVESADANSIRFQLLENFPSY